MSKEKLTLLSGLSKLTAFESMNLNYSIQRSILKVLREGLIYQSIQKKILSDCAGNYCHFSSFLESP